MRGQDMHNSSVPFYVQEEARQVREFDYPIAVNVAGQENGSFEDEEDDNDDE